MAGMHSARCLYALGGYKTKPHETPTSSLWPCHQGPLPACQVVVPWQNGAFRETLCIGRPIPTGASASLEGGGGMNQSLAPSDTGE